MLPLPGFVNLAQQIPSRTFLLPTQTVQNGKDSGFFECPESYK